MNPQTSSSPAPHAAERLVPGLLCAAALTLGLGACGCQESPSPSPTPTTDAPVEEPVPGADLPQLAFRRFDEGLPRGGTWRGYPSLLDFTGDGRDDIVVSNREEDGWNAWTAPDLEEGWQRRIEGLPRDLFYGGQDGADVDHDGDLDLILASHTQMVKVYLNDGAMNWTDAGFPVEAPGMLLDIVCANLDGDEHTDLVGIGHFAGGLNLYLGRGDGRFERLPQSSDLIGQERAFGMQVEVDDFDGDGIDDVVAATHKGVKAFFTALDDGGLSWNEFSDGLPVPEIGNSIRGLVTGDFNGDGRPELGWCALKNPTQPPGTGSYIGIYEWHPDQKRWLAIDSGLMTDSAYMDIKACDIDRDGDLDLIAVETLIGPLVYLGDGTGAFELAGRIPDVFGKSKIDVGDIDGDGWIDLLVSLQEQKGDAAEGGVWTMLNSPTLWSE